MVSTKPPTSASILSSERGGIRELAQKLAKLIEDLLGLEFINRHYQKHPGALAYRMLAETDWFRGGPDMGQLRAKSIQFEALALTSMSFSELFPGEERLTLGDLAAFAGSEYAQHLQKRAHDPSDYESVVSEVWIANLFSQAGFEVFPIRRDGEQADFEARAADGTPFQIECKLCAIDGSEPNLKGKVEKANKQFKADPLARPGLLVIQFAGSTLARDGVNENLPKEIERKEGLVTALLKGGFYRSVSAVLLIWDDIWEKDSSREPGILHRFRTRGTRLIHHPFAHQSLTSELVPLHLGATLHLEIAKPLKIPDLKIVQGPYSVIDGYLHRA